jgi:hypothetical protein
MAEGAGRDSLLVKPIEIVLTPLVRGQILPIIIYSGTGKKKKTWNEVRAPVGLPETHKRKNSFIKKTQHPGVVATPVIPAFGKLRQEGCKFEASLPT